MKLRNPFRKRYIAVIVGQWSGIESPVSFVTFRRRTDADAWCDRMNRKKPDDPLTLWQVGEQ